MKKFFMNLLLCLATVLCLMGFAACGETQNGGTNGTYYLYCNGGYAKNLFFKLEGDKWTDDDGATGTFTISNGEITFYYTEFGETFDLCDGTISNGVLYVMGNYYCKEGKTPTDLGNGGNGGNSGSSEENVEPFGSEGLLYALNSDNQSYSLSGLGTCTDTKIVIPSLYNGKSVTSIGEEAFSGCTSLTSVMIPDSVTYIGEEAFYDCKSLTSVTIPDSVTYIGWYAFEGCGQLQYTIENHVKYLGNDNNAYVAVIRTTNANYATYQIYVQAKVIATGAFYNHKDLTSIKIPNSVTYIGNRAFENCDSLTSVTIPDSITSIGIEAFSGCTGLTSVTCPALAVSRIPKGNLKTVVITSGGPIGDSAFYDCDRLTSVVIGDGVVTSIGYSAFQSCNNLTSVTIGDSVTSIGRSAFYGCSSLTSITFEEASTWYVEEYDSYGMISYQITVEDPFTNAKNFTSKNSYWYKQ